MRARIIAAGHVIANAAKATTPPLLNSAFRQTKGTGDLFVNATYFGAGVGGRRQTTVLLDGADNDEGRAVVEHR
jgi:hypothetical protein